MKTNSAKKFKMGLDIFMGNRFVLKNSYSPNMHNATTVADMRDKRPLKSHASPKKCFFMPLLRQDGPEVDHGVDPAGFSAHS